MKTSFLTAIVISLFSLSVSAQHMHGMPSDAPMKETKKASSLTKVLPLYYDISGALANDDASKASSKAYELVKALNEVEMNAFSGKEMEVFMDAQKKLVADGRKIVQEKDIAKQRVAFSELSTDLTVLVKGVKLTFDPVYEITCSMKKTSWLSNENVIKNPYLGKEMATCGEVTETIK